MDHPGRQGPRRAAPPAGAELMALVQGMVGRDESALAAFYDATSAWVYGTVLRILRNTDQAEEVVVDVYHEAWQRAALYDAARASPVGWVLNIAKSRAIDRLRATAARVARLTDLSEIGDIATTEAGPDDSMQRAERGTLLHRALADLSPSQAQVIHLAYFSGRSQTEIAQELSLPLGTVKTRIRAARLVLERKLRFLKGGA